MKQKLIALSKEKGFKSEIILFDGDGSTLSDKKYYLWLCELKLWMVEFNGIECIAQSIEHLREWKAIVDHDSITSFVTVYESESDEYYDSLPQALEVALIEGLKLTKKK